MQHPVLVATASSDAPGLHIASAGVAVDLGLAGSRQEFTGTLKTGLVRSALSAPPSRAGNGANRPQFPAQLKHFAQDLQNHCR